jgi:hypothetical protein
MLAIRDRLNMLSPLSFDVAWTALKDGVFNDYPLIRESELEVAVRAGATVAQAIPITARIPTHWPVLPANPRRKYLLIQNNSVAGSNGVAPNLYISYDGPPLTPLGCNKTLQPGQGLLLTRSVPINSVWVAWGASTAPATIAGVVEQGILPARSCSKY